ncbi:hypothetical protein D307_gp060 [Bacillus phage Bastille]|uniref:Uncharacterized protein n=2 Tax=Bastillevirus TaxID=1918010 RepID=J9PKP1_9CAUD|nr:hypothetical protein D307_gp060 [Bacillus phage Bastille]AEQ34404.1 hypothetical protein [Bacillus phage Bastille]ASU01124.1 hypothetical protein ANTHONY_284 [Bacillus phage Anthony]
MTFLSSKEIYKRNCELIAEEFTKGNDYIVEEMEWDTIGSYRYRVKLKHIETVISAMYNNETRKYEGYVQCNNLDFHQTYHIESEITMDIYNFIQSKVEMITSILVYYKD